MDTRISALIIILCVIICSISFTDVFRPPSALSTSAQKALEQHTELEQLVHAKKTTAASGGDAGRSVLRKDTDNNNNNRESTRPQQDPKLNNINNNPPCDKLLGQQQRKNTRRPRRRTSYLLVPEGAAGISNQREQWVNAVILADVLGLDAIVMPTACPAGYVVQRGGRNTAGSNKYREPFANVSAFNSCGPFELMMDADLFRAAVHKLGICLVDRLPSSPSSTPFEKRTLTVIGWHQVKRAEAQRFIYTVDSLYSLMQKQIPPQNETMIENNKIEDQSSKESSSSSFSSSADPIVVNPSLPLATMIYSRYYDKCDEFCVCNPIVRALRPNAFLRGVVGKVRQKLLRSGDGVGASVYTALHFRIFRCYYSAGNAALLATEMMKNFGVAANSTVLMLSEVPLDTPYLEPLRLHFRLVTKEMLVPQIADYPLEVRALIDYELGIAADTFVGYPGGSSLTQYIILERRQKDPSMRNTFVADTFRVCRQGSKHYWDGVPLAKYLSVNPPLEKRKCVRGVEKRLVVGGRDSEFEQYV